MKHLRHYLTRASFLAVGLLFASLIAAPAALADAGYTWTEQAGAGSLDWGSIASSSSGQRLAAVVSGGNIYTSSDYGVSWTEQAGAGSLDWGSIASSSSGQYLAAAVIEGDIYTSNNYGVTWADQSSAGSQQWESITSSSNGQYLAAAPFAGDIYTSNNYGVTWTNQTGSGSQYWRSIASSSSGQYLAAAGWYDDIYTSNNYGVTWTDQTGSGSKVWDTITSSSSGQYLAAAVAGAGGDIYTSSNYGASWTDQASAGSQMWFSITSSSSGQYLAAAGYNTDIWTSNNYGVTWTDQSSTGSQWWNSIASSNDGQYLAAAGLARNGNGGGHIYTANDSSLAPSYDSNDLISGGISSAAQAYTDCQDNVQSYGTILNSYGITCADLKNAPTVSIHSTDYNKDLYSVGRQPEDLAGETTQYIDNAPAPGPNPYYWRFLWGWDTTSTPSLYNALEINVSGKSTPFYILYNCANLVSVGMPTLVSISTPPVVPEFGLVTGAAATAFAGVVFFMIRRRSLVSHQ
jgi:hypothetical protein